MFKAGDGRLAGCGCRLHEEASRLALRKKTKGIFHLEKKQKQCFAPTDKKNLLRKNHKGRWTTYTLNVASEADDLPLFSQKQLSAPDASNPTVSDQVTHQSDQVTHQSDQVTHQSDQVKRLMAILHGEMNFVELLDKMGMNNRTYFRKHYLEKAIQLGLVEFTQPDSPRSPTQKYRLTEKGRAFLKLNEGDKVLSGKP